MWSSRRLTKTFDQSRVVSAESNYSFPLWYTRVFSKSKNTRTVFSKSTSREKNFILCFRFICSRRMTVPRFVFWYLSDAHYCLRDVLFFKLNRRRPLILKATRLTRVFRRSWTRSIVRNNRSEKLLRTSLRVRKSRLTETPWINLWETVRFEGEILFYETLIGKSTIFRAGYGTRVERWHHGNARSGKSNGN